MTTEFGDRLKAARKYARLTQSQLATKAGIASQGTVSELEKTSAGSSFTPQIATACKVNAHWLATGEGRMELNAIERAALAQSNQAKSAITFDYSVRVIAEHLMTVDESTRRRVMGVLADLASDPDDHERIAKGALALLESGKRRMMHPIKPYLIRVNPYIPQMGERRAKLKLV